ncbi:unnamed protein product, partial [Iphiclides podalirius]
MKIDTERVIIEVHLRPVLWDKRNELYKNRDAREAAWRDILKELAPNYENLSEEERKEADKKIQQRWRTARDTYQKGKISEKNQPSGSGSKKKKKKYSYYDILTFLDSTTETAGEESLCEEMSEQSNLETPNESTQPDTSRQESSHPTSKQKQVKSKKQAPSEFEAQLLECLKSNQLELERPIEAYLKAIGYLVDNATLRYKLRMPAWPNPTGDFGKVGLVTHWSSISMPSPRVCAQRIQEDLKVTATPGTREWNLPVDQPKMELGPPTHNCLGWARAATLTNDQVAFLESTNIMEDVFRTKCAQFQYCTDLFENISLAWSKTEEKIKIAPQF